MLKEEQLHHEMEIGSSVSQAGVSDDGHCSDSLECTALLVALPAMITNS